VIRVVEVRRLDASRVFDVVDEFARDQQVRGPRPGPLSPVRFFVVARIAGMARQPIDPPIELDTIQTSSGYGLSNGKRRMPSGRRTPARLDPGTYVIRAESESYQRVEATVPFPAPGPEDVVEFDLPPGYSYPFPRASTVPAMSSPTLLRGSLRRMDDVSVDGTVVQAIGLSLYDYRADGTGEWVLVFPDDQADRRVTVRFLHPDNTIEDIPAVDVVQGQENSLRQTALRGWVLTDAGAGIPGARIQIGGQAGEARTDGGGAWSFYFGFGPAPAGTVTVTAIHPDGRTQARAGIQVRDRATVSIDPFRFP
jgi:hypothetical protein